MDTKFYQLSPILWTNDIIATRDFYESVLGFTGQSNFPNFISLKRGNAELMFIVLQPEPEDCAPNCPELKLTGSLFIFTDHVDKIWESIRGRAVIKTPIADRAYLMRDFSILDNNGYEVVFGQDISPVKD